MLKKWIKALVSPPFAGDNEKAGTAFLLHSLTLWGIPALLLLIIIRVISGEDLVNPPHIFLGIMIAVFVVCRIALQFGYIRVVSRALLIVAWAGVTYLAWSSKGLLDNSLIAYLTIILASSLLLGEWETLALFTMCIGAFWGFAYADSTGIRVTDNPGNSYLLARNLTLNYSLSVMAIYFMIRTLRTSFSRGQEEIKERQETETVLRRQTAYLNALHETTLGIVNRLELYPLLESILTRACELVDTQNGLVELVLPDESALRLEVGVGIPGPHVGHLTFKNKGITGRVWARGKTQIVNTYSKWDHRDPRVAGNFDAIIGLPLKSGDKVIGVLALLYDEKGKKFTSEQVSLLERFASLASLAIQNARLYEEAQKELTERRLIQTALRENEEKFRKVFHSSPVAICISELDSGRVLEANDAYWDLMGLKPGDALGKTADELKMWNTPEERKKFVEDLKIKGSAHNPSTSFRDESGKLKQAISFYELVHIGDDERIISMFQDMSEQRRTMDALKESETRTRALLAAMPDMILEISVQGLITNMIPPKGMEDSMPVDLFIGRHVRETFSETVASQALFAIERAIEGNQMNVFEFDENMGGEIRTMEARVIANAPLAALIILRDVTQRKWIETEREQLINELEIKNKESETLRNSLASVVGTLEFSEIIQRILDQVQLVVPYDSASVWRVEGDLQKFVAGRNLPIDFLNTNIDFVTNETNSAMPILNGSLPYILNGNVQEELPDFQVPPHTYVNSWLAVPLMTKGKIIGLIALDGKQKYQFDEHHSELAVIFADQVAIALENASLFTSLQSELKQRRDLIEELTKANAEAETLRESTAIVAATLEKHEAIERILEQLKRVVPYDSASVQLTKGDSLEIVGGTGLPKSLDKLGSIFKIDENEPAYPVLIGKLPYVLFDNVQREVPNFNYDPHDYIHSWMAVPLKVKEKVIGIIALDGKAISQFTEHHAQLAVTYANQVAIALENARLFSDLQAELAIRQDLISELEAKNAELERFTYTVSHDLKSPLFTIRGFLGYLEEDAFAGNHERMRSDMQRITDATHKMQQLLNELLELSRVGRMKNESESMPFEELAREAVELVRGRIMERSVAIHVDADMANVFGDKQRLLEVVQNLVDNGAKFMGDQRRPQIEIGQDGEQDGMPIFYVRDNGVGIAAEHHERVFGLFNKLDVKSDGTGIGLALVKRIVEVHGGRIWIQSEPGLGTTFYFTLPAQPAQIQIKSEAGD